MELLNNTSRERWEKQMANKQYICCYQDCPLCGDKGKELKKLIFDKQLNVRKVSFASEEGRKLCHEAVLNHGIKNMPFFTDGTNYAQTLEELIFVIVIIISSF